MPATYYTDSTITLHHGDCLDVLRSLPDASVDAVCTDPPYGLEFMGKEWDGANGFRRSLNPNDAGRDNAFGRTSKTSPEYRTASKASATRRQEGGIAQATGPSFLGGLNPKCLVCDRWQRGSNPCRCEAPEWTQERLVRLHSFQEWCEAWSRECLRVLKPGGHMLAFGGTRTWHRLACAIEDAGFEVRDSLAWLYASGFPKSMNLDRMKNSPFCRCQMGESNHAAGGESQAEHGLHPLLNADVPTPEGTSGGPGSVLLPSVPQSGAPAAGRTELRSTENGAGEPGMEGRRDAQAPEGELLGSSVRAMPAGVPGDGASGRLHHGAPARDGSVDRALPAEDGSREPQGSRSVEQCEGEPRALPVERGSQAWGGWPVCERCSQPVIPAGLGTALKPAFEPIVVGRKPLAGTVAANVLAHGTGALNIDGCRVAGAFESGWSKSGSKASENDSMSGRNYARDPKPDNPVGRWPANVVLDESQAEVLDALAPETGGSGKASGPSLTGTSTSVARGRFNGVDDTPFYGDQGGASRFFYVAKADASERVRVNGVAHPTVKPLTLMRWLVRLVTPPGGTVLEPFAGSGTTVEACLLEGFRCVAIEREAEYLPLIRQRINRRRDPVEAVKGSGEDGGLFDLLDGGAA